MKPLRLFISFLLVALTASLAYAATCTITASVLTINGAIAANQQISFKSNQTQSYGGFIIPGGQSFITFTDNTGACCTPAVTLVQGSIVQVTVGTGQPVQFQTPLAASADLSTLILANLDPASVVSAIAIGAGGDFSLSVVNPSLGAIGTATLTPGQTTGLRGIGICTTAPTTGQSLNYNGTQWCPLTPASLSSTNTPINPKDYAVASTNATTTATLVASNATITVSEPDWVGNTVYASPTLVLPLTNNAGNFVFGVQIKGTSSASAPNPWCQTPPSPGSVTGGCTTVDGTVTWQNLGANIPLAAGFTGPVTTQGVSYPMGVHIANAGPACIINGVACVAPSAPTVNQVRTLTTEVPAASPFTVSVGGTIVNSEAVTLVPAPDGTTTQFDFTLAHTPLIPSTLNLTFNTPSQGILLVGAGVGAGTTENIVGYHGVSGCTTVLTSTTTTCSKLTLPWALPVGATMTASYEFGVAGTNWVTHTPDAQPHGLGVLSHYNQTPWLVTGGAVAQGKYQLAAGVYTFSSGDTKKLIDIRYPTSAPVSGGNSVNYKIRVKDANGGYTAASAATNLATISFPGSTQSAPIMITPSSVTGAEKYLIYLQRNGAGNYFLAGSLFPNYAYFLDWGGPTVAAPWVEEDSPIDDNTTNDPGPQTLYTTIVSTTNTTVTLAAAPTISVASLGATLRHDDTAAWNTINNTIMNQAGAFGGKVALVSNTAGAVSEVRQWGPWGTGSTVQSFRMDGGTPYNSTIEVFGDGYGPCDDTINAAGTNGAAAFVASPASTLSNVNIRVTNSTAACGINVARLTPLAFQNLILDQVQIQGATWNRMEAVHAAEIGGVRWNNLVFKSVYQGILCENTCDTISFFGGSWNTPVWPGYFLEAAFEYGRANFGMYFDPSDDFESEWNLIKPWDATSTPAGSQNHFSGGLGDPAVAVTVNGVSQNYQGVYVNPNSTAWLVGPLTMSAGTPTTNANQYPLWINTGTASPVVVEGVNFNSGNGILADGDFAISGANITVQAPGSAVIQSAFDGWISGSIGAASAGTNNHQDGFVLGFARDRTTAAGSSVGILNFNEADISSFTFDNKFLIASGAGVNWTICTPENGCTKQKERVNTIAESGGGTITPDLNAGINQLITIADTSAITLATPTNGNTTATGAVEWTLIISNNSGGNSGAITTTAYTNSPVFATLGRIVPTGDIRICKLWQATGVSKFINCTDTAVAPGFLIADIANTVGTGPNGISGYCSDCKNSVDDAVAVGAACVAGGHGAWAIRENAGNRCF